MTTLLPSPLPFDPELGAALGVIAEQISSTLTPEMIPLMRSGGALAAPTDEELRRDGRFDVEDRPVPGPDGAPDISLLIGRPTASAGTTPGCVYFTHGGGMIGGQPHRRARGARLGGSRRRPGRGGAGGWRWPSGACTGTADRGRPGHRPGSRGRDLRVGSGNFPDPWCTNRLPILTHAMVAGRGVRH
jgi:hypothetical protein